MAEGHMKTMFANCLSLTTITVNENNWNTANVSSTAGSNMFYGSTMLVGGNGTKFDWNHIGVEYARIDKPNAPGYLTAVSNDIEPVDNGDIDFGGSNSTIDENTDLDGNVIGNIYYNIAPGNGGYNLVEGCIEVTKPTSDEDVEELEGKDIFGEDANKQFTGIVFKVPAGNGTITVNGETIGGMTLKVKIGSQEPIELMLVGKMKMKIPYSVTKPTYVYIYAGEMDADASRRQGFAASVQPCMRLYGLEWNIARIKGDVNGDSKVDVADIASVISVMAKGDNDKAADVNGDGKVDVADIATVIDIMAASARELKIEN